MLAAAVTWNDCFVCLVTSDLPRTEGMLSSHSHSSMLPPLPVLGTVPGRQISLAVRRISSSGSHSRCPCTSRVSHSKCAVGEHGANVLPPGCQEVWEGWTRLTNMVDAVNSDTSWNSPQSGMTATGHSRASHLELYCYALNGWGRYWRRA